MIDIAQLERELTEYIATVLELEVDKTIFRGGVPAGVEYGVGVMVDSEIKTSEINYNMYNVQILGRFADRDAAWLMLSKMSGAVPSYGISLESFTVASLTPRGSGAAPYTNAEQGRIKYYASFNTIASVLTTAD